MKRGKRGKEKEEKERGESDFFVIIWYTFVDNYILRVTFHDPLRGKMAAGEKI